MSRWRSQQKRLTVFLTASPLTFPVARLSFLRCHCPVVDVDVIDQAEKESAGVKSGSGTNMESVLLPLHPDEVNPDLRIHNAIRSIFQFEHKGVVPCVQFHRHQRNTPEQGPIWAIQIDVLSAIL